MMRTTGLVWLACGALMACGTPSNNGGGGGLDFGDGAAPGGASCASVCARQAAAGCSAFNMGTCVSECTQFTSIPSCMAQATAVLQCGQTATFTCDASGEPDSQSCNTQGTALVVCALGDGGSVRDASGTTD